MTILRFILFLFILSCIPIQAFNIQVPFYLEHHKIAERENTLKLKTIYHHASANGPIPKLFRKIDINNDFYINQQQEAIYTLKSKLAKIDRPISPNRQELLYNLQQKRSNKEQEFVRVTDTVMMESTIDVIPDVTDRQSMMSLAMMTNNAYLDINLNNTEWYDLGEPWHLVKNNSFGWESDGIRGHIFANDDDSLIVISIKGTSAGLWSGGPTGEKDKINDNMLFSCCCARISRAWTPVCDCYKGNEYKCDSQCLQKSIGKTELYYDNALEIFNDVYKKYNESTIWITGHSLGGAVASMVGQTFGIPTVTFEIPGDKLASQRLHLPHGPGARDLPLWHFGHTADPIFVGVCTGPASSCWYGGFAMETRCHTGKVCVWDTVNEHGWRVDIRSHRVRDVIESILKKPDEFAMPNCVQEKEDCDDCGLWEYYDERDGPISMTTSTTTSTTTTSTTPSTTSTTTLNPPDDPWPTSQ